MGIFFFIIALSSHIHVQMGRELVRLIVLIQLKMFSIHIGHRKSPENILWTRFGRSALKNPLKMAFLALYKGIMHKTLIKSQKRPFLEGFSARIVPTMAMKKILRTSSVQYRLKTCSGRSDLSIAPTPDPFGHVYVKI